jgi:hypothetical protein
VHSFRVGTSIDKFIAVHFVAKLLHTCHHPCILLKVEVAKAFDTVAWSFLLDMLGHMGFSRRWIN